MKALPWLTTPLAATAGVMAGLFLISLPLRSLTSAAPGPPPAAVEVDHSQTPGVLRLRLLTAAEKLVVTESDGTVLLEKAGVPAGESEHDVVLRLSDGETDLRLSVECAEGGRETAVFLTVMPDGLEARTRHAIGEGVFEDVLHFEWPHAH